MKEIQKNTKIQTKAYKLGASEIDKSEEVEMEDEEEGEEQVSFSFFFLF